MAMSRTYYSVDGKIRGEHRLGETYSRDYLHDALGSIVAVFQNGNQIAEGVYKPYGYRDGEWQMDSYKFSWNGGWGYRRTGMAFMANYVRARHYTQYGANWNTVDPLWPSEMPFGYVEGRVLSAVDPTGRAITFLGKPTRNRIAWITGRALCPSAITDAVTHFCNRLNRGDLDLKLSLITDCIARSAPKGLKCQGLNIKRLKCMKEFCNSGTVYCDDLGPDESGYALGAKCPSNNPYPSGDIYIDQRSLGAGSGLAIRAQNPTGVFIHELLHVCGMAHVHEKSVPANEDKWTSTGVSCNNIASCCIIHIIYDKNITPVSRKGRSLGHPCINVYSTQIPE